MAAPAIPRALMLAILLLSGGTAWADAPARTGEGAKAPQQTAQAVAQPAQADPQKDAPLNPRWKVRSWTISGLTVWTFRPGHFERN
ncbi:MAG: hypothetical protein H2042_08335 [Rhizobiales bacterium]|nr:hypothetical protein [Hyphomicrobiales bacterium]